MTFNEYYKRHFQSDIQRFMMSIPLESRNHNYDRTEFTIQHERLTKDAPHLDVVALEQRAHFAIALFLSVLVDKVCFTHFKWCYQILHEYVTCTGKNPFRKWLLNLRDIHARARIRVRLNRIRAGNFGDVKSVGDGISELRISHGPGYRVYFAKEGNIIVLLLSAAINQASQRT